MKKLLKIVSVILLVSLFAVCSAACDKTSGKESSPRSTPPDTPAAPAEFTVSFDTDGGSAVPAITLAGGAALSAPADPAKEGYTFAGWFLGESATAYEFSTMPDGNIILIAHWTANKYTVTFESNGGTDVAALTADYGAAVSAPAYPAKEGHSFAGWFLGESATAYEFSTMPAENITLTAHWTANKYTVTFDSNGGTEITAAEVTYGEDYGELPVPEKAEYAFAGWFDNPELSGERIPDGQTYPVAGDVTLYAGWTPVEYTVSYELDGGTNDPANPSVYTIEDLGGADGTILLKDPEKTTREELVSQGDGSFNIVTTTYTFEGWYTDDAFLTPVTELSLSLGTVTLYAKWSSTDSATAVEFQRINADGTPNSSGDHILFGEYPQTMVTDSATISALGDHDSNTWTSYGYYVDGKVSDFMAYTDKEYNGERYRGVWFTSYRPSYRTGKGSAADSNQDNNGYSLSTVYWFKYEPVKWRILNESGRKALILCEMAIDSQHYYYDGGSGSDNKCNYGESSIRVWLNDTFYNTAFSDMQKTLIWTTAVDNGIAGLESNPDSNVCADKIFPLSFADATDAAHGFDTSAARVKKSTDYAKAQGCWQSTSSSNPGNCYWWLCSPYDGHPHVHVIDNGDIELLALLVDPASTGVVPALTISMYGPAEYIVSYELDGGTNDPANPSVYTLEDLGGADGTIPLKAPGKTKKELESRGDGSFNIHTTTYTFEGWYTDSAFENPVTALSLSLGTVTLYAKWGDASTSSSTVTAYQRTSADGTPDASGEYILFGEYPQTKVTDSSIISALGDYDSNTWTSYGYYRLGNVRNFMEYTDKEYNGERYRGVYLTMYRRQYCGNVTIVGEEEGEDYLMSYQDDNGYDLSTVYWFKYEPIKWRILNESGGKALILCEMAIDSQQYDFKRGNKSKNDYKESTIRKWLNDTFYNTAFGSLQQALIQSTVVDNSVASTGCDSNPYACEDTNDKVFLLSFAEATNAAYGLNTAAARQKKSTDYAKAQGCWQSKDSSYPGNCYWWLRSPCYSNNRLAYHIHKDGSTCDSGIYDDSGNGVVPALTISL